MNPKIKILYCATSVGGKVSKKDPRTDNISFCKYCLDDTERFSQALCKLVDKNAMTFAARCVRTCTWWDWFDFQRTRSAENKDVKFTYGRYKNKLY